MRNSRLEPHREEIIAAYDAGSTVAEIARAYDAPARTVGHFLKRICKAEMRPPHRGRQPVSDPATEERILELYAEGHSTNQIAKDFGVHYSHIVSITKRHGIKHRRRSQGPSIKLPTDPAMLGYLAGLIDGEGSITTLNIKGREKIIIQVVNTDASMIDWLSSIGGKVYWEEKGDARRRRKPCAMWKVCRAVDCYNLLLSVESCLISKKAKATAAIDTLRRKFGYR